jgi:hypothetical protein
MGLYLSNVGSLILKITRPRTFEELSHGDDTGTGCETYSKKIERPRCHDGEINEGTEATA